ncbi:unnamed protein product [Taenia asiatica]|uniref:BPTI/Kunitz inhibitor domain-containing protein n=1 Tax=Taenia asiatica TaxID=60517 RepID=A0A0R3W203_TAEAS|nr:unnamed protein product [Taenia asiatica]
MRPLTRKCSPQTSENTVSEAGYTKMRLSLLTALAILLLNAASPARAFDSRLSIGSALDTSGFTMQTEFPASFGEQVHMFQFPFQIYGKQIDQIKVSLRFYRLQQFNAFALAAGNKVWNSDAAKVETETMGCFVCFKRRDLDVNEVESNTCVWDHVSRIGNIIDTAAPDSKKGFVADYIFSITWENMGCFPRSHPLVGPPSFIHLQICPYPYLPLLHKEVSKILVNKFTLALLRMEEKSYAVFQYEDIQWTADHSTSSLPPEGGIFVHGVATPQLPRSNMHIEPNVWNEYTGISKMASIFYLLHLLSRNMYDCPSSCPIDRESNIAVPGEWLFPLHEGPIDVDVAAQSKIRMATEGFLETSAKNCLNMTGSSAKTTSVSESSTTAFPYSYTVTKTDSAYTTDYSSAQTKSTLDDNYSDVSQTTDLEQQFERCDSSSCANSMADCFYFDGHKCCVCLPNYYGGGEEGCWSAAPEKPRRIYLDGELLINLGTTDGKSVSAPIFLDTEVRRGETIRSQSGIHDAPQNFPSLYAITPIFSILNSFLALPRSQDSDRTTSRVFNIFSLTAGFTVPFNFTFTLDVSNYGRLAIRGNLRRSSSTEDIFRGSLNMEVTPDGQFRPLSSRLVGSDGLLQAENGLDRRIVYEKLGAGKVKFGPQTYNLRSEEGQTISVQLYGGGEVAVEEGSCLLAENSLMAKGQKFTVKMDAQGYCREDCRPNYGCSLYCMDMPVYFGEDSGQSEDVCSLPTVVGPCTANIQRYTYNRSTGRCEAFYYGGCEGNKNNFESLDECQRLCESSYQQVPFLHKIALPSLEDPCTNVRCGLNAYCASGYCYCNAGYRGDANTECRPASSGAPLFIFRRAFPDCTYNPSNNCCKAFHCGCCESETSGFEGQDDCRWCCESSNHYDQFADLNVNCKFDADCPLESDWDEIELVTTVASLNHSVLCRDVSCGYNARCREGRCECEEGYSGDPYRECQWTGDPCQNVRCGANAYCSNGQCFCRRGYEGDPQIECRPSYEDPCRGLRCGYYAHCSDGRCECDEGYSGDPYRECQWTGGQSDDICNLPTEVGPCNEVILRYTYNRSIGRCEAFYYGGCQGNANNFDSLEKCQQRCEALGQQGESIADLHLFSQTIKDPCAHIRCGHNAHCVNGYCYCNPGYEGDGNTYCRPTSSETYNYSFILGNPCESVRCGENAECLEGQCKCMEGYYGDPFHACRPIGSEMPSSNPKCQLPIDSGQCFDRLEKYGYDSRTGRCEKFLYTGCLGNENRFDTLEKCERECGAAQNRCKLVFPVTALNKAPKNAVPDKCFLPLITGTCGNTHTRFGFYPPTQRCEEYNYSGCGGNENRFETRLDCETVCNDPCEGVRCGYNARCVEGRCVCEPGFSGDPNYECKAEKTDKCDGVRCGANARCQDGYCVCEAGHSGDPYRECQPVGRFEHEPHLLTALTSYAFLMLAVVSVAATMPDVLRAGANVSPVMRETRTPNAGPVNADLCKVLGCDTNAVCLNGECKCRQGFTGDPYEGCVKTQYLKPAVRMPRDSCHKVACGVGAFCDLGTCHCPEGSRGNPYIKCQFDSTFLGKLYAPEMLPSKVGSPAQHNRCNGVQCASNAYCESGYCRCNPGYAGDGFVECHYQGSCANVQCGTNAHCVNGRCVCWPGYTGDPDRRCDPAVAPRPELCGNIYCHEKARCHSGTCYCEYGYAGDGVRVCEKVEEDLCKRVQCAENAECEAGLCQCKPGYKGDGFSECTPMEVDPSSCNGRYCGANAECRDGVCVCVPDYTGDPYDICTRKRPLPDSCHGIECGSNAYCQDGGCVCFEGFEGDPNLACKPIYDPSCVGIRCGANAYCRGGRCVCPQGYVGDANQVCYPVWVVFQTKSVLLNETLLSKVLRVLMPVITLRATRTQPVPKGSVNATTDSKEMASLTAGLRILVRTVRPFNLANLCDCRGLPASMTGCSNGKCRCMPGFKMNRDNYCEECRGSGECAANAQCIYDRQIQHYRCACDAGFLGDGAIACISGAVANRTEAAQCRVPCHRFATCDEYDGRCKCRSGFIGNGYTYCDFDCSQCHAEAQCVPESNQCVCPPGFTGDGIRICRPATSQGLFTLRIVKDSETIRVREGSGALTLRCVLSGDVRNVQARWLTPGDVGRTDEQTTHEGRELWLTIGQPSPKDSGLYVCQASRVSDTINVIVEPQQRSILCLIPTKLSIIVGEEKLSSSDFSNFLTLFPEVQTKQLFLTSDNGILTVQTQSEPTTAAQIWHIAEANKHKPVALALDCKTDRLIYTSDGGRALRFGNASVARLNQPPELIFQDNSAKFTWIAVDPASGNVFAIDKENNRIVVVNPDRPNQVHTYKQLADRRSDRDFIAGGIAVHPGLSLVYWAQAENSDFEKGESVIKVASMADSERVSEITRVTGAPISMSLAVTDDVTGGGNTAGRLCWLQRRQLMPYSRTEIHCAQLEASGRAIHSKRLLKSFGTNEEPSYGLIQDDDTIFWTSLYRKIYRSLNPSASIYVKGVCCSNGFQSMVIHNTCKRSMTNTCSYENGRCRYFCLPGGREMAHVCRCPDDQPNCIAEHARSRFLGYPYS